MKTQKTLKRYISSIILVAFIISGNVGAAFGADNNVAQPICYQNNGITIEYRMVNNSENIVEYRDENNGENFNVYSYGIGTNKYSSETYDNNGILLNRVVQEDDRLVTYDAKGNTVAITELNKDGVSKIDSNTPNSYSAYTWENYIKKGSGNTEFTNWAISTIISTLVASICTSFGIGPFVANAMGAIAGRISSKKIPIVYYTGSKQLGWTYGTRVAHIICDVYQYGNYTGYIGHYDEIVPVH